MTTLRKTKNCFKDKLSLNACQKYYRMLPFCNTFDFINLTLSLRSLFCLILSCNFTQVLLYLHLLPIAGLFTIKFNGYQFEKLKKNNFPIDLPILVKQGRVRGNKNIFKVGLSSR